MALTEWTEKYRPASLDRVLGNNKAVAELRSWARAWEDGKPAEKAAILYGSAGVGKTSAALALAAEMGWDCIEMNASDQRTASAIGRVAGPASRIATFSGRKRMVVLDEADNLHGNADRGGASAMLRLVRETSQPVILIANEFYQIDKALRDACKAIQFRSIRATTVASFLRNICREEGMDCEPEALMKIAENAGGDLRSAVNDLQAAAGGSKLSLEDVATSERDAKASIFKVLDSIFKGDSPTEALRSSYSLDESPEDLVHWIDENLPQVYRGEDLFRGMESLSRADVFLGRVRRRQNYGLWRYATFFMTGGIQAAGREGRRGYIAFKPPSLWRRLGQTRRARNVRDSAASKVARHCHVGTSFARFELMDFIGSLLKGKKIAAQVAATLDLNADEIALLIKSTPSTKKVQAIFEEGQRLREVERIADIESSWGGVELQAAGQKKVEGRAEEERLSIETSPKGVEGRAEEERLSIETSQKGVEQEEEPRRGGKRARKASAKADAPAEEGGKGQRSLFDF